MTPYKTDRNQGESDNDSMVPSVSLFDFVEELLREPERLPSKKKKTARK